MPTLNLNDLQAYRLYEFLLKLKGRGLPHARRLRRLAEAFGVADIEAKNDEIREALELAGVRAREAVAAGRQPEKFAPPHVFRVTDPPTPRTVDAADLEFLATVTRAWDKEEGVADVPVGENWTIYLPIYEEIERAVAEAKGARNGGAKVTPIRPEAG